MALTSLTRRYLVNNQTLQLKKCNAWLPPDYSEKCGKEVDPLCQTQCFEHCYNKQYPETHYLRCKNPQHPPYQESDFLKQFKQSQEKIKQLLWQYPYATNDISTLSKQKLKNAIRKDIQLLKQILPLEDCLVPDEDDLEMWEPSACDDLIEEMDKISQILNHENGLRAKLDLWENYRETGEEEYE